MPMKPNEALEYLAKMAAADPHKRHEALAVLRLTIEALKPTSCPACGEMFQACAAVAPDRPAAPGNVIGGPWHGPFDTLPKTEAEKAA